MRRKSFAPWLVALVCLGPFAAALLIYYGPFGLTWLPQLPGSRELLRDPVPLPPQWRSAEARPWQLVYATMSPCEQQCVRQLGRLLQVQRAFGRVYVTDPRGLVILSYPPDVEQKELLRDLERLLSGPDS